MMVLHFNVSLLSFFLLFIGTTWSASVQWESGLTHVTVTYVDGIPKNCGNVTYTIETQTLTLRSRNLPIKVLNLSSGRQYDFKLTYACDVDSEITITSFTAETKARPEPPYDIELLETEDMSTRLRWKLGVTYKKYFKGYQVEMRTCANRYLTCAYLETKATEVNITELQPDTCYWVVITAVYSFDSINASIQVYTNDYLSGKVEDISVAKRESKWIVVSWKPPRVPNGLIFGYCITLKSTGGCQSYHYLSPNYNKKNMNLKRILVFKSARIFSCSQRRGTSPLEFQNNTFSVKIMDLKPSMNYSILVYPLNRAGHGKVKSIRVRTLESNKADKVLTRYAISVTFNVLFVCSTICLLLFILCLLKKYKELQRTVKCLHIVMGSEQQTDPNPYSGR